MFWYHRAVLALAVRHPQRQINIDRSENEHHLPGLLVAHFLAKKNAETMVMASASVSSYWSIAAGSGEP
ncbi:MAG TPA: hypothetical protein VLZ53_06350 [Devosia sp.]|nr:hypothetical protein [Devosia sp.]